MRGMSRQGRATGFKILLEYHLDQVFIEFYFVRFINTYAYRYNSLILHNKQMSKMI
jgi:hypothetical protein